VDPVTPSSGEWDPQFSVWCSMATVRKAFPGVPQRQATFSRDFGSMLPCGTPRNASTRLSVLREAKRMATSRPNIVYIHSHDSGRCVSPYGYAMPTPHIQCFAEQGVTFRNAFCAAPSCSPSRAALLTGMYPHSNGMNGLVHRGAFALNDYSQHLLHTLRDIGYHTVLGGLQHIAQDTADIGFDCVLGPTQHGQACVEAVVPRTEQFLDSRPGEPFFLDIGFFETHKIGPGGKCYPCGDDNVDSRYVLPPSCLPDTPETRFATAQHREAVRVLDQGIGALLTALDRNGFTENTLVLVTTDHGLPMPRMKRTLSDHGLGVMMMMRGPGGFAGGRVIDGLVSQIDVFPTLCELLEIPAPDWLQGVSFLPLVAGTAERTRDYVFAELTYHTDYVPKRAVRGERYKYVRLYDSDSPKQDSDGGPAFELWRPHGWPECVNQPEQLYDLLFDPAEANNLIDHPDYQDVGAELGAVLDAHLTRTRDPIVHGPIPPRKLEDLGYVPDSIKNM
jgi:N-sulfoglucosamine sulfohydrolase